MQYSGVRYTTISGVHTNIMVFIGLPLMYAWVYHICILVVARNKRSSYRPTCDRWHLMNKEERPMYINSDSGHLVASRSRLYQITRLVQRSHTYRDSICKVHHEALRHLGRFVRLVFGSYHRSARQVRCPPIIRSSHTLLTRAGSTAKITVYQTVLGSLRQTTPVRQALAQSLSSYTKPTSFSQQCQRCEHRLQIRLPIPRVQQSHRRQSRRQSRRKLGPHHRRRPVRKRRRPPHCKEPQGPCAILHVRDLPLPTYIR
jgi:hypothetical protein